MKKLQLSIALLFSPLILFAQAYDNQRSGINIFIGFLVGFVILLGIFLIIRSLVLWYWKVYELLQNQASQIYEQKQTNYLLAKQIELLNKHLGIEDGK